MASMAMTAICSKFSFQCNQSLNPPQMTIPRHTSNYVSTSETTNCITVRYAQERPCRRLLFPYGGDSRCLSWPIAALGSGLEASITDQKKNDISLDNVKIVVESRDEDKIHVRVDLTGEETQKAFDDVLTNFARTAPPIPGFRRTKGGKTANVPKSFLLQVLGRDRVIKFLIQEIVSTSIGDYVKKENLTVKSQCKTTQTAEELESAFAPGSEFGFNASVEIEKSEPEAEIEKSEPEAEIEKSEPETDSSSSS